MVSPHSPLAVNKSSQDQQGKQDCVHFPEDLEGGEGRRVRRRGRGRKEGVSEEGKEEGRDVLTFIPRLCHLLQHVHV